MKNFWRMRACSIFSVPYAYVDHCSYLADTLFVQNKENHRIALYFARCEGKIQRDSKKHWKDLIIRCCCVATGIIRRFLVK